MSNYIAVYEALRPLPAAALEQCMRQIRQWAAIPNEARSTHRTLNSDQLVALAANGLIDIGAHTVSHPLLPAHPYEIQRQEILDSNVQLEDVIQRPIEHFAYPYGQYDQRTPTPVSALA
jgi:peptidoglycan/xylan/chitin deacetylase (PgdA/CDA1 family)